MRNRFYSSILVFLVCLLFSQAAQAKGLTIKDMNNVTAKAPDMTGGGFHKLKFKGGKHNNGEGTDSIITATVGDLDGDGFNDGAIIFYENWGGSGCFTQLSVFLYKNGKPVQVGLRAMGDRSVINKLYIKNKVLTLDVVLHRANDPAISPTLKKVLEFRIKEGKLVGPDIQDIES